MKQVKKRRSADRLFFVKKAAQRLRPQAQMEFKSFSPAAGLRAGAVFFDRVDRRRYNEKIPDRAGGPETKEEKLKAGGYDGKTVVLGIRPEDLHDESEFVESSQGTALKAKIRVYEMVGAEVFLCFEYEGTNMTARVAPKTAARTGDIVKFALDADKIHVFDKDTEKTITN